MNHTVTRQLRLAGAGLSNRYPARPKPLADPAPGSGLKPVNGDFGPPVAGYIFNILTDAVSLLRHRCQRYGSVHWMGMLGRQVVIACGPEATEAVLIDRDKAFSAKKGYGYFIGPFFDGGLLLRDFDEHLHHRRIMQPAFTRSQLTGYLDMTNPGIERALNQWHPGPRFALYTHIKQMLLDIAAAVFMDTELGPQAHKLAHAFEDSVQGGQAIIRAPLPGGTWARGLRGRKVLQDYFTSRLPEKRASSGNDLFSALCHAVSDDGQTFNDQEVVDHMIFLMMAAHDTTTIATSMLGYHLGKNQDWQTRLRRESQAIGNTNLRYEDFDRLPLLDMAFKEALRMYSPVGQQVRETVKDTEICGHYIPAGTLVSAVSYASMRIEQWWHNPDVFDPQRFANDRNEHKAHRLTWSPFGGGAHKCIGMYFGGMQAKSIIYHMLMRYQWSVPANYQVPLGWGTGPTPTDGVPIQLQPLASGTQKPK